VDKDLKLKQKLISILDYKTQRKYLHAIQICEKLIGEYPANAEIHYELAELYELSGNLNSAFHLLENYLDNNPKDKDLRIYYGQFLLKHQLWNKAIEIFSPFAPEEKPITLFFLGHCYFMLKDFELARINFLSFLSLESDSELVYESYIYLAKIEIEIKDFEQALSYAKQSETFYNSHWELNLILAICFYNLGMDAHAVLSIEKAIKLNPKAIGSYEWAGRIFLRSKDYLKAEKYFIKFVESSDEVSADTYTQLGEACYNTNNTNLALNYFELALRIDPLNTNAIIGKKNLLEKTKTKMHKDA